MEREMKRIGFVGLGLMGGAMAKNLLAAGYEVVGYDVEPAKVQAIVDAGGTTAPPHRMPHEVEAIMLSLPSSQIVNDVVRNTMQIADTGREGLIIVDASTADPELSSALARDLRAKGIEMLDATVSGTSEMCAVKDIIFMVGGSESAFGRCRGFLGSISREVIHMGENGAGAIMKLVVNLVLGLNRMALAEGLTLAKKAGLDPLQTLEVLKQSAAASKIMDQKGYRMVRKQFLPAAGKTAFYYKDVRLMLALGERLDCPLPLISLHAQALASEIAKGRAEWDSANIISFYDELANLSRPEPNAG
jgi:3-hydroxyisobutyrate dehydrogenase-like beta-hydroxyacid dehydrogenase